MHKSIRTLALLGLVLAAFTVSALASNESAFGPPAFAAASSDFKTAACPMPMPAGVIEGRDVLCGFVTVPERHNEPFGGSIQLAVAVIKSSIAHSLPDPIVFIDGGPGVSSLSTTFPLLAGPYGQPILQTGRDFVMVEQRGTALSKPSLHCPEVFAAFDRSIEDGANNAARGALIVEAYSECSARLEASGINLSAYNSIENAADFPLVVKALGYTSYNVYSVSYGTQVAQHLMRDYPAGIRSVVLSAPIALDRNVNAAIPESAGRAFQRLSDHCAADLACNSAFPDLEASFLRLVYRLNQTPLQIAVTRPDSPVTYHRPISGDDLIRLLSESLGAPDLAGLPKIISDIESGKLDWLQQRLRGTSDGATEALGQTYSVICSEGANFSVADMRLETPVQRAMAAGRPAEMLAVCANWPVEKLNSIAYEAVKSDIPTLVMSGEFDVITPSTFHPAVTAKLTHAYAFEYPGEGHGGIDACRLTMMLDFYAAPSRAPDASCIATMHVDFEP